MIVLLRLPEKCNSGFENRQKGVTFVCHKLLTIIKKLDNLTNFVKTLRI